MIGHYESFVALVFALMATAVGQLLFKMYYVRGKKIYLTAAFGTFVMVPLFSYLALLNLTLAYVYMSTALIHVMVLYLSYWFLREELAPTQYISVALILVGIIVFNF